MKCCDCAYWYQKGNNFPECIWQPRCPGDCAPCEENYVEEEYYVEDNEDE